MAACKTVSGGPLLRQPHCVRAHLRCVGAVVERLAACTQGEGRMCLQ